MAKGRYPANEPDLKKHFQLRIMLRITLVSLAAFALLSLAAPASWAAPASSVEAIEEQYWLRNYDAAWTMAVEKVSQDPGNFAAIRILLMIATEMDRYRGLDHFIARDPRNNQSLARWYFGNAWAAWMLGDRINARSHLDMAEKHAPDELEIQILRLMLERGDGEWSNEELYRRYQDLIARHPDHARLRVSYATAVYGREKHGARRTEAVIRKQLAADVHDPELYVLAVKARRGELWFDANEALKIVDKGLAEFPAYSRLGHEKVITLRRLGRTEEALALAREWRRRAPNHGSFIMEEASLLADLGDFDAAADVARDLRSLKYQPSFKGQMPFLVARYLHYGGRTEEAASILDGFIAEAPNSFWAPAARTMLQALESRRPSQKATILPRLRYLEQKGNYCGPAAIHMLLASEGVNLAQDEIAGDVYTRIAGTPPQAIHHFAAKNGFRTYEFQGTEDTWKQILDAGYPVLWLQMLGQRGAHYRVVVGYDDVLKNWIVNDPNDYSSREIPFDKVDDDWILPNLRRSIVFQPAEKPIEPLLADLRPTTFMVASNWALYIATGTNLLSGLFPAILVNLGVEALLLLGAAWLMRGLTYPAKGLHLGKVLGGVFGLLAAVNLAIGLFRFTPAVGLLLGLNLGLVTLVPLLAVAYVGRLTNQDFLHPRETLGVCAIIALIWITLSMVDRQPWETVLPIAFFALGLPVLVLPRLRIMRGEKLARAARTDEALAAMSPYGARGYRYFAAEFIELDLLFSAGRFDDIVARTEEMLSGETTWPRPTRNLIALYHHVAAGIKAPDAELRDRVKTYLGQKRLARSHRLVGEALLLWLDSHLAEKEGTSILVQLKNNQQIDELLRELNQRATRPIAGLPYPLVRHNRTLRNASFLLAVAAAMRLAGVAGNEERRRILWNTWASRHGLMLGLLQRMADARGEADGSKPLKPPASLTETGSEDFWPHDSHAATPV